MDEGFADRAREETPESASVSPTEDDERHRPGGAENRVRLWAEKEQAGFAAWASPHVTDVANNPVVRAC